MVEFEEGGPARGIHPKRKNQKSHAIDNKQIWHAKEPSKDVSDSLADFQELCMPYPKFHGGIAPVGEVMVLLNALYDEDQMVNQRNIQLHQGTSQIAARALVLINGMKENMQNNPERYLYKPSSPEDMPARNPNIRLLTVLETLENAIKRDFEKDLSLTTRKKGPVIFRP